MAKKFMDKDFLLENEVAKKLFHEYAKDMPIYDYHCHLNASEIYEDKNFNDIFELWLGGDHYKWRLMRGNGIDEKFITGEGTPKEKFLAWAKTLPLAIGNPLYHWTHLELQRYFDIYETLSERTAEKIWNAANEKINKGGFSARKLIEKSNVEVICTTDDPTSDLSYHKLLKADTSFKTRVLPAFRPDNAVEIKRDNFVGYIKELEKVANVKIVSYKDLCTALSNRIDYFHENGCRLSDHGLERAYYLEASEQEIEDIFQKGINGMEISACEEEKYKTAILTFCGKEYGKRNWTMQLHMAALRNNNTKMKNKVGPDSGFDASHDLNYAYELSRFLDGLCVCDLLPKTIVYTLNPKDNFILMTQMGCFQENTSGKMQFGSGWWFVDQRDGMVEQMKTVANLGILGTFIGMLTDSRSFISYPRHEYFRRIMCNIIGGWVENGEYPEDYEMLEKIVKGISYENAVKYFDM